MEPTRTFKVELAEQQIHELLRALEDSKEHVQSGLDDHEANPKISTYTENDLVRLQNEIRRIEMLERYLWDVLEQSPENT